MWKVFDGGMCGERVGGMCDEVGMGGEKGGTKNISWL